MIYDKLVLENQGPITKCYLNFTHSPQLPCWDVCCGLPGNGGTVEHMAALENSQAGSKSYDIMHPKKNTMCKKKYYVRARAAFNIFFYSMYAYT